MWTVFNTTFLVGSLPTNLVYIVIFAGVEIGFALISASYFVLADGHTDRSVALKKSGGAFCFLAGMFGWYVEMSLWRRKPAANMGKVSCVPSHNERRHSRITSGRYLEVVPKKGKI